MYYDNIVSNRLYSPSFYIFATVWWYIASTLFSRFLALFPFQVSGFATLFLGFGVPTGRFGFSLSWLVVTALVLAPSFIMLDLSLSGILAGCGVEYIMWFEVDSLLKGVTKISPIKSNWSHYCKESPRKNCTHIPNILHEFQQFFLKTLPNLKFSRVNHSIIYRIDACNKQKWFIHRFPLIDTINDRKYFCWKQDCFQNLLT